MEDNQKVRLLRELENLVAFQKDCLAAGNWEDYDQAVSKVEKLERVILDL